LVYPLPGSTLAMDHIKPCYPAMGVFFLQRIPLLSESFVKFANGKCRLLQYLLKKANEKVAIFPLRLIKSVF
jgi:hypothetical protein